VDSLPKSAKPIGPQNWMSRISDSKGKWVGIVEWHLDPQGKYCGGFVPFRGFAGTGHAHRWDVLSEEPLTLSPSLKCNTCGNHGYIREGRWTT